jgi:DNA-binding transcriptional ArsR family regulator
VSPGVVQEQEAAGLVLDVKPKPGVRLGETSRTVLRVLESGEPRSTVQVALACGLSVKTVYHALYRLWYMGLLLRSSKATGRVELPDCGYSNRPDYHYVIRKADENSRLVRGVRYVADAKATQTFPVRAVGKVRRNSTTGRIVAALSDHGPLSFRQLVAELSVPERNVSAALYDLYRTKRIVHSEKRPIRYAIKTSTTPQQGKSFVTYKKHDGKSKRQRILEWISTNLQTKAIFTVELRRALVRDGVQLSQSQIMDTLRRREWAQSGIAVYIRGYQQGHRQSPFAKGYAITAFDNTKPVDVAQTEAVERTERLLKNQPTKSPVLDHAQKAYNIITDLSLRKDIASTYYVRDRLGVKGHRLERVLEKTMELYPNIRKVSVFGNELGEYGYPHYYNAYHISKEHLTAAIKAKEGYIIREKSGDQRKGHSLEGVIWRFLERALNARFLQQKHRTDGMHPYRHTIHLIRPIGQRKRNAELDGVWLSRETDMLGEEQSVTNILEVKYSLISKQDFEDYIEKVRWSKEYGADSRDARIIKNGVILWLAGEIIDNNATIRVGNELLTVAAHARRLGIKFIKISDINHKLRQHGWIKASIKTICRVAKDSDEAMQIFDQIWKTPAKAKDILSNYAERNHPILEKEKILEDLNRKHRLGKTIFDTQEDHDPHEVQEQPRQRTRITKNES